MPHIREEPGKRPGRPAQDRRREHAARQEPRSFAPRGDTEPPGRLGPAGDPAEGKRDAD